MTAKQQELEQSLKKLSPLEISQMKVLYRFKANTPEEIAKEITDPKKIEGMLKLIAKQVS